MKSMTRFLIFTAALLGLVLIYVHVQILLFRVSYDLARKSRDLAEKTEAYRYLKYEVDQLRAPYLLEKRMKQLELDLGLPRKVRVIRIPALPVHEPTVKGPPLQGLSEGVLSFMERWIKVAQAKTEG